MPAASSDKVVAPLEQRPLVFAKDLTTHDRLVLTHLAEDLEEHRKASSSDDESHSSPVERRSPKGEKSKPNMPPTAPQSTPKKPCTTRTKATLDALKAKNDPSDAHFDPTVFVSVDLPDVQLPKFLQRYVLSPYIKWARHAVRNESDVVMITHLILYFTTSVPSALYLFYSFDYWHAFAHVIMQGYYMGTYTLMMHQHIHGRGILSKRFWLFDTVFPYITDPLMGHTWNTYFYHHVKHHHVEGNGPNDLSSTLRYQRDDVWHFLHYIGRFYFLIWFDLPRYFLRKGKTTMAAKAAFFEIGNYLAIYLLAAYVNKRAAVFVFVLPLAFMRIGLMVGNWGQHAFVDDEEPDSDFRSSITLIDVPVSLT
ncbi:acylamide-delta3(E)-desaturase, partial [Pseudovirgaria hyperparasitica]